LTSFSAKRILDRPKIQGEVRDLAVPDLFCSELEESLRTYELVVIMSPQVDDEEVSDAIDRLIRRPVESRGGEIEDLNHWGRRKLAYPIKKQLEGNYVVTQLRLEPALTRELEQGLRISEDVMRHLLILADAR
jgi:small subunit ribosomal protein S6